jgi:chitodextrinase
VPGAKYQVQVWAVDTKGNWGVPSALLPVGKVSAPAVPAAPPASKDHLELPAGADSAVSAGATMKLSGHGYLPNSTVSVIIYSSPRVLTSVVTDGTGSFEVTVTVPKRLESGHHTLVASGVDPSGKVRYVTLPVTVSGGTTGGGGTTGDGTPGDGDLAYTGFDVALPLTIGLFALGVGGALMFAARRRKVPEPAA